ncbi:MAG: cytochrome c [Steroidobacteraceae bacterium]
MTPRLAGTAALLTALLTVLLCAHAADRPQPSPPSGQQLFLRHCGICHLPGGTGTFMLGRRLGKDRALLEPRRDLTCGFIRQVVRHGIVSMPRFTRVELTDRELTAICEHLSRDHPGGEP